MPSMIITLNGTDTNRWAKMNLRQNPFPQIALRETDYGERLINSLDGDPLTGPEDIRERLKGCSEELIEACISEFKPGERVKFKVHWPD